MRTGVWLVGIMGFVAAGSALGCASAEARTQGIGELGLGGVLPVADTGYRDDFGLSPTIFAAGVYLPRYSSRVLGFEVAFEWTPFADDYRAPDSAPTDFDRFRILAGVRHFRPLAPGLTGFARALAGVDIFAWTHEGHVGTVTFTDSDAHVGVALELGAGVLYELGPVALGAQLAIPVGVHRQETFGSGIEVNHTGFDLDVRMTVGTKY